MGSLWNWTLAQLGESLALEAGKDWTDSDVITQVQRWIADGYTKIHSFSEWPWSKSSTTIVLSAGVAVYPSTYVLSLPGSNIGLPYAIRFRDPSVSGDVTTELIYTPEEQLVSRNYDPTLEQRPQRWSIKELAQLVSGGSSTYSYIIRLWPIPDQAYVLEVFFDTANIDLVAKDVGNDGSLVIPLPEDFVGILRDYVRYMIAMDDGDPVARGRLQDFQTGLITAKQRWTGALRNQPFEFAANDVPTGRGRRSLYSRLGPNYPW